MVRLLGRCLPIICMPRKNRQSFPICEHETTGTKHQGEINKLFVRRVESIRVTQQGAGLKRLPLQTVAERRSVHKKTKSKLAQQNNEKLIKPDDTEFDCETQLSDRQSKKKKKKNRIKSKKKPSSIEEKPDEPVQPRSRTPLEKLFHKTKKAKSPSPAPVIVNGIPDDDDDTASSISSSSSISSDWSTTTYPDSQSSDKSNNQVPRRQSLPVTNLPNPNHKMKHRSCVESFYLGKEHVRPSLSPPQAKKSLPKITEECKQPPSKRDDIKSPVKSKQVLQNVRKMIKDQSIQDQHFNQTRQRESVRL